MHVDECVQRIHPGELIQRTSASPTTAVRLFSLRGKFSQNMNHNTDAFGGSAVLLGRSGHIVVRPSVRPLVDSLSGTRLATACVDVPTLSSASKLFRPAKFSQHKALEDRGPVEGKYKDREAFGEMQSVLAKWTLSARNSVNCFGLRRDGSKLIRRWISLFRLSVGAKSTCQRATWLQLSFFTAL